MGDQNRTFDKYSQNYKDVVQESIDFSGISANFFLEGKAQFLKKLAKQNTENKVLDVGCGVGEMHPYMDDENLRLFGIDISTESIKEASKKNPQYSYKSFNGETIPFDDNVFDIVYASCVFHHIPPKNWESFAKEMTRVTKKGGIVAIFEHNPYNPLTRLAVSRCPFDKDAVLLTSTKTIKLLKSTQKITPKTEFIFFFPFKNKLIKKIEQLISFIPIGAQYCSYGKKA